MKSDAPANYCICSDWPLQASKVEMIQLLDRYFQLEVTSASAVIESLKNGERVRFEFQNPAELNAFLDETREFHLPLNKVVEEDHFDEAEELARFQDKLNHAGEWEIGWSEEDGYGGFYHPATGGMCLIERDAVAQFIAKEMVARGAKLRTEEWKESVPIAFSVSRNSP